MDDEDILLIPGAGAALLGIIARCGEKPYALYDRAKLTEHFVAGGMSEEDADEWIQFNIDGAWMGPFTPAVLNPYSEEELNDTH